MRDQIEVPKEIEVTLYTYVCIASEYEHSIGVISHYTFGMPPTAKEKYVLLAENTLVVKTKDIDINGAILKGLYDTKKDVLANHEVTINNIQTKIDNMLAIEYKAEEG